MATQQEEGSESYYSTPPENPNFDHGDLEACGAIPVSIPPSSTATFDGLPSTIPCTPWSPSSGSISESASDHQTALLSNPIANTFRELELGKSFLTFIMPIAAILLALPNKEPYPFLMPLTLCLICAALVFLFYGNSLRNMYPKAVNVCEQCGTACICGAFFLAVGFHLPSTLIWFPFVCFIACVSLSVFSCLPFKRKLDVKP